MSAYGVAYTIADHQGWTDDSILALALEYIDNQQDEDGWRDFLLHAAELENELGSEEDE